MSVFNFKAAFKSEFKSDRRQVLKASVGLGAFSFLSKIPQGIAQQTSYSQSPIQILSGLESSSVDFNGDNTDKPHDGLWNPEGVALAQGGWPKAESHVEVAVVGGGMSGLLAAYKLKNQKPVLFDLDKHFGGNSKGEKFKDVQYSTGAAYVTVPDEGSAIDLFFKELGLDHEYRHEASADVEFFMKNKRKKDFWGGVTDPARAQEFQQVNARLEELYENSYPEIPWYEGSNLTWEQFKTLDSMSFASWLTQEFGQVHPHILEYFQLYGWSSFTASISEISAAQMLNFVLSEIDGVLAFPGGNAAITQKVYNHLRKFLPSSHLKTESLVIRVRCVGDKVAVYYMDPQNKLRCLTANKVILACQKFVAKRICVDMPSDQQKAIDSMSYRGYVVANAIYKDKTLDSAFDLYQYDGQMPKDPTAMNPSAKPFTDVVMGAWAQNNQPTYNVLTMYRPLPFDGARQFLFSPMAHEKNRKAVLSGLSAVESEFGISDSDRVGLRLTRWGHSLPVAQVGFIAQGTADLVNRPIQQKIFFANQDNFANPAFECSFAAVESVLEQIQSS